MTSVQMSRDLQLQATSFLRDHFQDSINEDDLKLVTNWISMKLDEERQGWKKKIQMAFKEVEKERKLSLSIHTSIQKIVGMFDAYLEPLFLYREPSQYHSAEEDRRVGNVEQLEKNIHAILRLLDQYQEERIECLQYLNTTEEDINLAEVFRKRIAKLEHQLVKTEAESNETEQRLLAEIQTANDALDMQTKLANDQQDKNGKEIAEMRKLLGDLKLQVRSMPAPPHKLVNKGIQVNIRKKIPSRECCIQVSLDMARENNMRKNMNLLKEADETTEGKQIDIIDLRPPSEHDSAHPGISSITIVKQRDNKGIYSKAHRDQVEKDLPTMHTRGEAIVTSQSQTSSITDFGVQMYTKSQQYAETEGQKQTINFLRHQVVDFANKLDKAKYQVDRYHEHMTLKKSRINGNGYSQNDQPDTARTKYSSRSIYDFRHDELKGFLSGVKVKDGGTQSARDFKPIPSESGQKPIKAMLSYSGTSKCLRCNTLYRAKENTDASCKFHHKNKKKFEKYDSSGKLEKILQLWECCMQGSQCEGCQTGPHI